jgi:xanthine dehydrogenase YagR molybdenum-binding subunit
MISDAMESADPMLSPEDPIEAGKPQQAMRVSSASNPERKQLAVRYDGLAKVTGAAKYAVEFKPPVDAAVYAFIVQSTIPSGSLVAIDQAVAERASGVLAVITPFNAPQLPVAAPPVRRHITVLQEKDVFYNGQPVAVVVATSLPQAKSAASLLKITYKKTPAKLNFKDRLGEGRAPVQPGREPASATRGDIDAAMAKATFKVDETYTTPYQHHSPMEPHATLAWWDGDKLNVYDSTQGISGSKQTISRTLGIPLGNIHLQCPYTGGGFGSKGSAWSHVVLACMAAKIVQKPVKLALERPQMWGTVGARPNTVQRVQLGATADGKLTAISHEVILYASVMDEFLEPSAGQSRTLYAAEANHAAYKMVDMNIGVATSMRAPGESSGTAALEVAMDELAEKLNMDPIQLRLINYAENDPSTGKPWSAKHLRECYTQAADRFGWSRRSSKPSQFVEGNNLVGYGMATATYHANRSASLASVHVLPNGHAIVSCGSQELGTGTYTIMAQIAADELGLDPLLVEARLGDTALPKAPGSGGSTSTASIGPAILDAAQKARIKLAQVAVEDSRSPLHGADPAEIVAKDGRLYLKSRPAVSDSFADIVTRAGGNPIEGAGSADPGDYHATMSSGSWGAVLAEVAVDRSTHMTKVRRVVATYDIGTLVNRTTGLHQLSGGIVWGISFALHEESQLDNVYGRFVNNNLGEYHIPANRDIGEIDVTCLNIPDTRFNSIGARGLGEIGVTGTIAAVANAIYNATGKRIRDYPITPDKIMLA